MSVYASPEIRPAAPPPPPPRIPQMRRSGPPRTLYLALFAIGLLWLLAARTGAASASQGIAHLLRSDLLRPVLEEIFALTLLVTGFTALNWVATRNGSLRATNALPLRATAPREWQKGVALGWGLLLVTVLPMAVAGDLHPQFWFAPRAWLVLLLSLLTLLVRSLVTEIAFRGFLFESLIATVGPSAAMVILSAIYAFASTSYVNTTPYSFLVSVLIGFLFSLAYLRTHGLWIGWGLRFGWLVSMAVLFGLPIAGNVDLESVVATDSSGKVWLTGGAYGPQGALFAAFVLLAGMFALYQMTRDYAWEYTHEPIVPGGYPMEAKPPAAHVAMERAASPAPLVQILGVSSTNPTTEVPGYPMHVGPASAPVVEGAEAAPRAGLDEPEGEDGSRS